MCRVLAHIRFISKIRGNPLFQARKQKLWNVRSQKLATEPGFNPRPAVPSHAPESHDPGPRPRREAGSCSLVEEHIFVEGTYVSCSLFGFISPVSFLPFGRQYLPRLLPLSSGAAPPSCTSSGGLVQTRLLSKSPD